MGELITPDFCRSAVFYDKELLASKVCDGSDITVQLQSMNSIGPESESTVSLSEKYFSIARIVFSKFRLDMGQIATQDQILDSILVEVEHMNCKNPRFLPIQWQWLPSEIACTLVE